MNDINRITIYGKKEQCFYLSREDDLNQLNPGNSSTS